MTAPPIDATAPHDTLVPAFQHRCISQPLAGYGIMIFMNDAHEIWLPVVGLEGVFSVSNLGRVRSEKRTCRSSRGNTRTVNQKILSPYVHKTRGYLGVTLQHNGVLRTSDVHLLVAKAFLGPCPAGFQCAHNDGDRTNCRADNLRWDSCANNNADKRKHGTRQVGERHGHAKLTEKQVLEVLADNRTQTEIAMAYGVSQSNISRIKSRDVWSYLHDS